MKFPQSLLAAAALAGVSITSSAFANPSASVTPSAPRPVLSTVVKPMGLPLDFSSALVDVEFNLDQAGQPHDIRVRSVRDPLLKRQLVKAISQWRFTPAADDAATGRKRYVLPLQVTAEG